MNPTVSIIIPAYNAEEYLREAVLSALQQSVALVQVIIVDDGSQDRTLAIAQDMASKNAIVETITRPNGGSAAARNTGLSRASGEFVLFLDADDRLHENAIHNHLTAFAQRPEVVMVFGANDVVDAQGAFLTTNPTPIEYVTLVDLAIRVIPVPSQSMYRKSAIDKIGGYNERFRQSQDVDLNLRLARIGQIYSHGMKVVDYRQHPTQVTRNRARTCKAHADVLESNFGVASASPDSTLLKEAKAILYSRFGYGQVRAALGALKRGRILEAGAASKLAFLRIRARIHGQVWRPKASR